MIPEKDEYLALLKSQDRATASPSASLSLFDRYLDATGLDYRTLRLRQAQEFQSWAMGLCDDGGKPHYAKNTSAAIITSMRGFYTYLREKGLVYANPFTDVKGVVQKKQLPARILDVDETGRFLADLAAFWTEADVIRKKDHYRAHVVAEVLYSTGMNISEVAALTVSDVDVQRGTIRVKAGRASSRLAILCDYAREVLSLYLTMRPYILAAPQYRARPDSLFGSGPELTRWINREFGLASDRLKIQAVHSRDLRHALGLHLVKSGCDARFVQKIVGHERLNTTQLYVRLDKRDLRAVIDRFHPRLSGVKR